MRALNEGANGDCRDPRLRIEPEASFSAASGNGAAAVAPAPDPAFRAAPIYKPNFTAADLQEALQVVQQLDPPGVGAPGFTRVPAEPASLPSGPARTAQERKRHGARFCKTQSR